MESIGVLIAVPKNPHLESEISKRFNLFRLWTIQDRAHFLSHHGAAIYAVVGNPSAAMIDALPRLEMVAIHGVGVDKVDLKKCKERGIRVSNTPDVLTDDVADLAIALMIALLRRVCGCHGFVNAGQWANIDFPLSNKFSGKRVGIIGLGRIGSAIAKRAEAFNCPIAYYSRTKKTDSKYTYYPGVVGLASNCDILVVACALTNETCYIVNREVIDALGQKGYLINIGRGPLVDELELMSALAEGRLAGAGLDVFEHEPHVPEELLKLENVVLLPHVGTGTVETRKDMADIILGNLEAHFNGKPLLTPVI